MRAAPLFAVIALAACATPSPSVAPGPDSTPDFSWLTGCWRTADGRTTEVWSEPQGGLLLGWSVTLGDDGRATAFEQIRIETIGPQAAYVASPGGGPSTRFEAALTGPGEAIFSAPSHDFPQTVAYHRERRALTATVATLDRTKALEYRYLACR